MYLLAKLRHGIKQPDVNPVYKEEILNSTKNELQNGCLGSQHEIQPSQEVITSLGELIGYQPSAATIHNPSPHIKLKQLLVVVKRILAHKLKQMAVTDLNLLFQIAMKKYPKQMPSAEYHLSSEQTRHFFYLELFKHWPAINRLIILLHILHIIKVLARPSHRTNQCIKLDSFFVKEVLPKAKQVKRKRRSLQNKVK